MGVGGIGGQQILDRAEHGPVGSEVKRTPGRACHSVAWPGRRRLPESKNVGVGTGEKGSNETLDELVDFFKADSEFGFSGFEVLSEQPVELDGAEAAQLTESRFELPEGDKMVEMRALDLHVVSEGDATFNVAVTARNSEFDDMPLRDIVDSFRLR